MLVPYLKSYKKYLEKGETKLQWGCCANKGSMLVIEQEWEKKKKKKSNFNFVLDPNKNVCFQGPNVNNEEIERMSKLRRKK